MRETDRVTAVAVIVPAHDEEDLLEACLAAIAVAAVRARRAGIRAEVHVVLDACRDRSAAIAHRHDVAVIEVTARCVGIARDVGARAALEGFADEEPAHVWLAHTDADSTVPPNWIEEQAALARGGADVVVGTVRPDFDDLSPAQRAAWLRTYTPGAPNGHVHGANLGIRGSVYLACGGFAAMPVHEDVHLVDEARARGARIVASDAASVHTSGRAVGRAPDGYARYLRDDLLRGAAGAAPA